MYSNYIYYTINAIIGVKLNLKKETDTGQGRELNQ